MKYTENLKRTETKQAIAIPLNMAWNIELILKIDDVPFELIIRNKQDTELCEYWFNRFKTEIGCTLPNASYMRTIVSNIAAEDIFELCKKIKDGSVKISVPPEFAPLDYDPADLPPSDTPTEEDWAELREMMEDDKNKNSDMI